MATEIPLNTATVPMDFPLIASSDHVTPLYGKAGSVVVAIRKLGGQWQAPAGAITEKAIGAPAAPTTGSASNTGGHLAASTQYFYKITAINILGESLPSAETTYTTPAGTATNQITLTWTAVVGASGYKVYRSTSTGAELLLATLGNVLTYADISATTPSGAMPTQDTTSGGFYSVAPNATDSNTPGPITFVAKDALSDYSLDIFNVVGFNPLLPDMGLNAATVPASPTLGTWGSGLFWADSRVGRRGTAQAGSTTSTIVLDSGASAVDNAYKDHSIKLTGGTGAGQFATITGYVGSSKTAAITRPLAGGLWSTTPDASTVFQIEPRAAVDLMPVQTAVVPADVQTIKTRAVTCAGAVTVNANVGTVEPVAFTGTGAAALVKADATDFGGSPASPFDGIAPTVTGTTVTLDSTRDGRAYQDNIGNVIQIGESFGEVASSDKTTHIQTLTGAGWQGAGTPAPGGYVVWTKGASTAPDPLASAVPGSYSAGTAGAKLGNLDATVSSRSTYAGGTVAGVAAPVTVGTNNDKAGYSLAVPGVLAGTVAAGSTGSAVVVSGLPTGKVYKGQRLYHYASGEARVIADQSFASGNYTFAFTGAAGTIGAPFDTLTTGDFVSTTP